MSQDEFKPRQPRVNDFILIEDWFGPVPKGDEGTFIGLIKEISCGQYHCIGRYKTSKSYVERYIMMCDPTLRLIPKQMLLEHPNLAPMLDILKERVEYQTIV
jgi:hypothetical protein